MIAKPDNAAITRELFEIDLDLATLQVRVEEFSGLTMLLARHHDESTDSHSTRALATNSFDDLQRAFRDVGKRVSDLSRSLRDDVGKGAPSHNDISIARP